MAAPRKDQSLSFGLDNAVVAVLPRIKNVDLVRFRVSENEEVVAEQLDLEHRFLNGHRLHDEALDADDLRPRGLALVGIVGLFRRVLIAEAGGETSLATVGRVKTEIRPMLLIEARIGDITGTIFLQNAETVCLTTPEGKPVSVAALAPGDTVLCLADEAGRHFGARVREAITER